MGLVGAVLCAVFDVYGYSGTADTAILVHAGVAKALRNSSPAKANRALPGHVKYAQIPQLAEHGLARARQFLMDIHVWLEGREFIAAQQFSVADITAVVAVDFARIIKIRPDERHPHLLRWERT